MWDTVSYWVEAGGPIVVILGVVSIYSLALVVLKAVQFWGSMAGGVQREAAIEAWRSHKLTEAWELATKVKSPVNAVLVTAMERLADRLDIALLREEIQGYANTRIELLGRHLRTLEVIAVVSPLMGLLGTVLGMIEAFQQLELAGGSANAAVLAAGIWQALLTTAMGLIVAIPAAVAASLLSARLDRVSHAMEDCVTRLLVANRNVTV